MAAEFADAYDGLTITSGQTSAYSVINETEVRLLPTVINIFNLKINNITNNASVNIGESLHNSHTANTKAQGTNASFGDVSPPRAAMKNIYIDPDMNDQGDILTTETAFARQT
jgi:hypothetical protein